ncbi:female sexual development-1 protein [Rhypophila decipiens]|uniref:Female sexual development-1 protein n=1 Tax=Rhypophila decipiens TaxID=261697 RepID=A0AAN6YG80_9PEZI|nr:female sexual development-1 protein [Rhypophila decipiens]
MRYTQDSLSTTEAPAQPSGGFLPVHLIPPIPQSAPSFAPESNHFFPPTSNVFGPLDVRSHRLGSNSTSAPGMAHARSTTLPHPGPQLTRDIYTTSPPAFRRQPDHISRSPNYQSLQRRHPLSPQPNYPIKMDSYGGPKSQQNIPPLNSMTSLGILSLNDPSGTIIKADINGVIDKGFFLAEDHWTCYRRNYFSCVCSFSLNPSPSAFPNAQLQFMQTGHQQALPVYGFAMSISAVVADSDNQAIELVQHTPKRDKGPVAKPEKVRLSPKAPQPSHHPLNNSMYGAPDPNVGMPRDNYPPYGAPQNSAPTEHTFERIQFKQATANNGKRRAAQQYYHLLVELWADCGGQNGGDQYVKIAFRKSAKMIVRGRSPGHYQTERRGSTSSGPGGSGGGSISGGYNQGMIGSGDYGPGSSMMTPGYPNTYDPRPGGYGGGRHHGHDLGIDQMISPEDEKVLSASTKGYQYYPTPLYESDHQDHRHHPVELYSTGRSEAESNHTPALGNSFDPTKVKPESDPLPSLFYPSPSFFTARCGRFEGKPTSNGYYPTSIPPTSTMNMT